MNRSWIIWSCLGLATVASLGALAVPNTQKLPADDKPFHNQLLEIAKSYGQYRPVDYRQSRWAPGLCRAPIPYKDITPAEARTSASKDTDTHGQKLYFLFAKDRASYLDLANKPVPVGQTIVKQSWQPVETTREDYEKYRQSVSTGEDSGPILPSTRGYHSPSNPFAEKAGKWYRTGKQADLYIMFKMDPATPATDEGWVYGTVTADGKTVTSAGKVESCMACHKEAKKDRLFGLVLKEAPWEKTDAK